MIEINEKEGMRVISTWNSTEKELDLAEEGLNLLVCAPTNLQIFSIMNNITTNSLAQWFAFTQKFPVGSVVIVGL